MSSLKNWMLSFLASPYAPFALLGFAFAESSFFPIPPDIMLIPLAFASPSLAPLYALLTTVGSVLGALFGYSLGYYGGYPLLKKLMKKEKLETIQHYYDKYNAWAVGIAGLTPIPFKLFTLSGGAFRINLKIFTLAAILSRGLRFFAVALLSATLGETFKPFVLKYINLISVVFVILLVGGFLFVSWWSHKKIQGGKNGS